MPSDPARSPLGDDQHVCSMPGCRRPSRFQIRLETGGGAPAPARSPRSPRTPARDAAPRTGDSCGRHLTDVVQALIQRCRAGSGDSGRIVVYATPEGRHPGENGPPGPFDRLALGIIPI
ncbi:hypothetical protein [Actinomadura nitritigenes]|uniref:hypothetical protein n=1 Tax=Actinomadura nitritigenes TaxID=134602 RepID=UPI003D909142